MMDLNDFADDTSGYNLLSFGNVDLEGSSDTQGGIAVGGSLTIGGAWTIASETTPGSNPSLFAAGSVSLSGTTDLNNGYAALSGLSTSQWTWSSSQQNLTKNGTSDILHVNSSGSNTTTNPITNPTPTGWNWSTLQSSLETVSSNLASATATGTISVSNGNLVFSGGSGSVVVFDLDASELSGDSYNGQSFSNIQINVPTGVNYVINVTNLSCNTTLFDSGINFNAGTNDNQLLWNFEGCSNSITIGGGGNFYGSILAPDMDITDDTTIDGQVVASAFTDTGVELHDSSFSPAQVLVPEPADFALWASGLCAAAWALRRLTRRPVLGLGSST